MKIASFFLFLLVFCCTQVQAQYPGQLKLNHLTLEDGLSQSSGQAILQDSHGFMWFGTLNGLNKYNGYDFTVYRHQPQDSTSISSSHISYLYEDSRGNVWIGTTGAGLNLFDRDRDTFIQYKTEFVDHHLSISDNSVSAIIEDTEGKFWVGTMSGLNLFDRDTEEFIHFFAVEEDSLSLSSSDITVLYVDTRDRLWIGTSNGLNYWESISGTFRHYKHDPSDPNSISDNTITAIHEDSAGSLWVGTDDGGLNRFDRDRETFVRYLHDEDDPESISGNSILSILEDSRGVLWIGTENQGLNAFNYENETFQRYKSNVSNPASLNHNSVYTLYENNDNILWIGTFSGGISYIDRKLPMFEHYHHDPFDPKPLNNNNVSSFLETSDGAFLVGTDGGGLNVFDRETQEFTLYRHDPDDPSTLSSDVILAMHEDSNGRIWIGYYNGGISVYDPADDSLKHYRHDPEDPHSLSSDHVFAIHEGPNGQLWFGTNGGGINQLDPETGRFKRIATETPGSDVTRDLYHDTRGNLWVGSYGGGLFQVDPDDGSVKWQFFEGDNGLTSNVVLTIHEDRQENLWIGTHEGGLHKFDRDTHLFTSYSVEEGLPNPAVLGILEDDDGNLWLSTLNGLAIFNPETETVRNYNVEHGIQSHEFNPLAYYQDREGFMYFGGINGFNRFHPERVVRDLTVPPVVFTDFQIFNQSVSIGGDSPLKKHINQTTEIVLPHTASVLTIDYVALNFNTNKGDEFAYMLEGFDSDWNYVDQRRSATYTNLNPGEYTFRVKAANSDGVWGENAKSLSLIVTPPFWQTTWFYLLSFFMVVGIAGGILRWRDRNIIEHKKRLQKAVTRQTSELSMKNSELKETLKELNDTRSELVEKAHKAGMADLATNVLHNVGNILNSVNVSANLIDQIVTNSKLKDLKRANALLEENMDNLEEFILKDPRGKTLLQYYPKLEKALDNEQNELTAHKNRLTDNVKLIVDVVSSQQDYSRAAGVFEQVTIDSVVEDTLKLQAGSIERHALTIRTDYQKTDTIEVEKSKLIHTLFNLLKNAKEAMEERKADEKKLTLKTFQDDNFVCLSIRDNGKGIPKEHLGKIFNHGFTTRENGHGFGLHGCANYMQEIGGDISVTSDGPGKGAIFTLYFPRTSASKEKSKRSGIRQELIDADSDRKSMKKRRVSL